MPKMTLTLALILAGGLAAGIALARPDSSAPVAAPTAAVAEEPSTRSVDRTPNAGAYGDGAAPADGGAPAAEGAAPAPAPAAPAAVTIADFAFATPASVASGQPIVVTNNDSAPHTLTFVDGSLDTGTIDGGGQAQITAPAPGTYAFFCEIHPSMTGELVVS
ncbi:MAG: cupredoxin domain-containing protein [Actinomycetota bacterium]